jgi:hypothetical protein
MRVLHGTRNARQRLQSVPVVMMDDIKSNIGVWLDVLCAAKDETSVEFMRPLLNSWAESSAVISCGKVDYDKSG